MPEKIEPKLSEYSFKNSPTGAFADTAGKRNTNATRGNADADAEVNQPLIFMQAAIRLAQAAGQRGDIPIGAVVVKDQTIVGMGWNCREQEQTVAGHAELMALADACHNLGSWRLTDCDLYVTLEPCLMCFGALQNARIRKLYFGAYDPKAGAICSKWQLATLPDLNHRIEWEGGVAEATCQALLKKFFRRIRRRNKKLDRQKGGRSERKKVLAAEGPLKRLQTENN